MLLPRMIGLILLSLSTITANAAAEAETINAAVASNFTAPMKALVHVFEASTGHNVRVSYGSSGKFYAQVTHGAPFHLFLSADQVKPQALIEDQLAVANSRVTYAVGALALWSAKPNFIKNGAENLRKQTFNKLSLANPKLAPYGMAAVEVLNHLQLTEWTRKQWVQGENIAQTYQFIRSGNADLGFVALSQVMHEGAISHGSGWIIPNNWYQPIKQDAVLLKRGANSEAAKAFLQFLVSPEALNIIESFGYQPFKQSDASSSVRIPSYPVNNTYSQDPKEGFAIMSRRLADGRFTNSRLEVKQ